LLALASLMERTESFAERAASFAERKATSFAFSRIFLAVGSCMNKEYEKGA
jgi:hypothetical protein